MNDFLNLANEEPNYELGLEQATRLLDKLGAREQLGPPDFERGCCGECGRLAYRRWRHGRFGDREGELSRDAARLYCRLPICRICKARRLEVAERLPTMTTHEPPLPKWQPPTQLDEKEAA